MFLFNQWLFLLPFLWVHYILPAVVGIQVIQVNKENKMPYSMHPSCPLLYNKCFFGCTVLLYSSPFLTISLSPTDYRETGQTFNLLKGTNIILVYFTSSLALFLAHTFTDKHTIHGVSPHSLTVVAQPLAHWLTACFPLLTCYVL